MTEFKNIIGNENIKLQLKIALLASKINNTSVPHCLLSGPPGVGKTLTSRTLAETAGLPFFQVSAETLKKEKGFADLFNKFPLDGYDEHGNIVGEIFPPLLFIDEVHQLSLKSEEILGIAMEEYIFETSIESEYSDFSERALCWVPRFTLIGATTMVSKLSKPFKDRFKMLLPFKQYSLEECEQIVELHATNRNYVVEREAANEIAKRGRGTPRILVMLLDRVCQAAAVAEKRLIDRELTDMVFDMIGVDEAGLTETDINILKTLNEFGVPVGIEVISVISGEDKKTISDTIEPYLIRLGFMARTKRGRIITEKGKTYLNSKGIIKTGSNSRILKLRKL